jgi:hypothetical protein
MAWTQGWAHSFGRSGAGSSERSYMALQAGRLTQLHCSCQGAHVAPYCLICVKVCSGCLLHISTALVKVRMWHAIVLICVKICSGCLLHNSTGLVTECICAMGYLVLFCVRICAIGYLVVLFCVRIYALGCLVVLFCVLIYTIGYLPRCPFLCAQLVSPKVKKCATTPHIPSQNVRASKGKFSPGLR